MFVFVGLGNPGSEYANNRHNVGFMFLDFLYDNASKIIKPWKFDKYINAEKAEVVVQYDRESGTQGASTSDAQSSNNPNPPPITYNLKPKTYSLTAVLLKPHTFMNRSGETVAAYSKTYHPSPITYIIVHDDLDIRLGNFKIQKGVGPKVHNGITSIEQSIGTKDFWRVRIGVDNRLSTVSGEAYVLSNFEESERMQLVETMSSIRARLAFILKEQEN